VNPTFSVPCRVRCRVWRESNEIVAKVLFKGSLALEARKGGARRHLIESLDGKPDMHDDVFADRSVGKVLETDLLLNPAKINGGHRDTVLVVQSDDLTWQRKAHLQESPIGVDLFDARRI
jgi:hypothetical protein